MAAVNHKSAHYSSGIYSGKLPIVIVGDKSDNLDFSINAAHYNSRLFPVILGLIPLSSGQRGGERSGRQGPKDRLCHRGGTVAAAEFARFETGREGAIDGLLDHLRRLGCAVVAVPVGEPVQHHNGR
jgi:hypothetical protein